MANAPTQISNLASTLAGKSIIPYSLYLNGHVYNPKQRAFHITLEDLFPVDSVHYLADTLHSDTELWIKNPRTNVTLRFQYGGYRQLGNLELVWYFNEEQHVRVHVYPDVPAMRSAYSSEMWIGPLYSF